MPQLLRGWKRWVWVSNRWIWLSVLTIASCLIPAPGAAEEIIFLQDGRTIQADKTEVIGDRIIRIQRPSQIIDIPQSDVVSIHEVTPSTAPSGTPPPADVYRDMTPQMNEKARRDTQQLLIPPRVHRP